MHTDRNRHRQCPVGRPHSSVDRASRYLWRAVCVKSTKSIAIIKLRKHHFRGDELCNNFTFSERQLFTRRRISLHSDESFNTRRRIASQRRIFTRRRIVSERRIFTRRRIASQRRIFTRRRIVQGDESAMKSS